MTFEEREFDRITYNITASIFEFMQEKGVSQKKLAKSLGVSEAWVSKMLSGDTNLTLRTIAKICSVLETHAHFKLNNTDEFYDPVCHS